MSMDVSGVRGWMARSVAIVVGGLVWASAAQAASLDARLLPAIEAATFEVVAAKPAKDPLHYAKELPLDQVPFQERNDKYYSIGTAFAIGGGQYVTAGHVLLVGLNSLWGPPALRDSQGRVYSIDKVRKFSLEKDFVVFTLASQPGPAALALETRPSAGQVVYSVGNAYGTGVVIRDGLYTSDTPEGQDGRWKWMRFSAAASPGNSGGPLIDQEGKVIGIVLAKSPNENLNYALRIGMVNDAADGVAEVDQRVNYGFDVFDTVISNTFKATFALPLGLDAFFAQYAKHLDAYTDSQLKAVLAKDPERMFPLGEGSSELLNSIATMGDFPMVMSRNANGTWGLSGDSQDDIKLSSNGYFTPGSFGKNALFHLRKPDDVAAERLYGDPVVPMDLILKTGFMTRPVAGQKIVISSLGKPNHVAVHVDKWGRRWQEWEWPVPYDNAILAILALPVPDGYVGVAHYATVGSAHDQRANVEALTNFLYVNYDGTLAQWRDFLGHGELLPAAFKDIHVDFDYANRFHYASDRVRFDFTPELQPIQPDSVLTLGFAYFADHGRFVWDVAEIWLSAKATDSNYLMLTRNQAPTPNLGDDYQNTWEKLLNRRHPYDATARNDKDATKISTISGPSADAKPLVLYNASYTSEGTRTQDAMQSKIDLLVKSLKVTDQ
jgi:hypothetical protein